MKPEIIDTSFIEAPPNKKAEMEVRLATAELAAKLSVDRPSFIEIGIYDGTSCNWIIQGLNMLQVKSRFFAVDLNDEMYDWTRKKLLGWKPSEKWAEKCDPIKGTCEHKFIEGSSHQVAHLFESENVVWCLIDGCHCYDCAFKDIEAYGSHIVPGGFLLIHDTNDNRAAKQESQHYHDKGKLRKFGVIQAMADSRFLQKNFDLFYNHLPGHGMQVWRRK